MTKCTERGCRSLEWKCADCGRIAKTAEFASQFMQWVSVKDRLPEHESTVLVAIYRKTMPFKVFQAKFIGKTELLTHRFYVSGHLEDKVTHWMPLPEPPV